jgi:hypothetical protein
LWYCDACLDRSNGNNRSSDLSQITSELKDELQGYIKTEMSAMLELIQNRLSDYDLKYQNISEEQLNQKVNNAIDIPSAPKVSKKHVLLMKPDDNDGSKFSEVSWSATVKKSIEPKLKNIPVTKVTRTNDGKGVLIFPSAKIRDQAAATLKDICSVKPQDRDIKFLYPKLRISGIPKSSLEKVDKTTIKASILDKNPEIEKLVSNDKKTFEIIFINEEKDSEYCSAVAKVDHQIKKCIELQGKKLFIGLVSCRVYERYHLIQCYQCQGFGHKKGSSKCRLKDTEEVICLYCAEEHASKGCPLKTNAKKVFKCYHCSISQKTLL